MPNRVNSHRVSDRNRKSSWALLLVLCGLVLFQLIPTNVQAQSSDEYHYSPDSVYKYFPDHSPAKATWMSAALPGLGQYYNGRYWKIPIIYAGFSTFAFFVMQNKYEYNRYKEAYAISVELPEGEVSSNLLVKNYTEAQLLSQREYYQSNLEMSYILTGFFYILQIVDAAVDAHLYDYDISDELSIHLQPMMVPTEQGPRVSPGIGLRFKLSKE